MEQENNSEEQLVTEAASPSFEERAFEEGAVEGGINPLAVVIPLVALLLTLVGGIVFLLLRTTYVRTEARSALTSQNQELTQSAFVRAVREGTPELVKKYLDAGLSPRDKISPTENPLRAAIDRGNLQVLELILNRSIPLEHDATNGSLPVRYSAKETQERECYSLEAHPLNYAAARSRPAVLELLARYSETTIHGQPGKLSPLSCAAMANNTVNTEWLLDHGADPNRLERGDKTPLAYAVSAKSSGTTQILLQRGANSRTQLSYGETAIFDAARDGDEAIVSLLLQTPMDLNRENFRGERPWQVAEAAGRFDLLPLLHPEYLLYAGLSKQNPRVVAFALERGARVNVSDRDGITPLHVALSEGTPHRVRYLLKSQAGPSFSASGAGGTVKTNNAALSRQFEDVRRLIQKLDKRGALPSALTNEDSFYSQLTAPSVLLEEIDGGSTPYIPGTVLPALREDTHSLPAILLLAKADPNTADIEGNVPLHYAVQRGELPLIEQLLRVGADYERTNKAGISPLLHAVRLKRPDIALAFLNHNPPTELDANIEQVLLAAVETGQNGVAYKLLKLGASPNVKDKAQRSLIIIALTNGNFELAKQLKVAGATLDLTEKTTQSLYLYSRRERSNRLREFIEANASGKERISADDLERSIQNQVNGNRRR